ncbi:MAG: hypothetical protein RLZZ618_3594 [Pseudomonadota bacterium]|jgi:acyl-CoA thioesterase
MSELTLLSALLDARTPGEGLVEFVVPEDWMQGRTTFGGLISVMAVRAMRDVAGRDWPESVKLRALQTSFVGPVDKGPVQVTVQVLREGKNVRQIQAQVRQNGSVAAVMLGVFGSERETTLSVLSPARPQSRSPEEGRRVPFVAGLAPNFTQHIDMSMVEGDMPYSGSDAWHSRIHLRLKHDTLADTELLTVLLADVPPSPIVSRFKKPAPASSVSWALELRPLASQPDPRGFWRVDTEALASAGGYVNQVSRLWTPTGELASLGYQVVAAYA